MTPDLIATKNDPRLGGQLNYRLLYPRSCLGDMLFGRQIVKGIKMLLYATAALGTARLVREKWLDSK